MLNRLKTSTYNGDCPTIKDGRQAQFTFKFYKPFQPKEHNNSYISFIEKGDIAQYLFTMEFNCVGCNSCKPLRVNTRQFQLSNKQKSILRKNTSLNFRVDAPILTGDFLNLYNKYMSARHPDSSMNNLTAGKFSEQVSACDKLAVLRDKDKIVAYALLKMNHNSIVCEYVAYDPNLPRQSLGNLINLKLIEYAQDKNIQHIYLGEINLESRKLKHKGNLSGSEVFSKVTGKWIPIERNPASLDHIP